MRIINKFRKFYGLSPVSRHWGFDRGDSPGERTQPIDRYYIENFLSKYSSDIKGRVLEIGELNYTRKFGGDKVVVGEILDINPQNKNANYICNLANSKEDLPNKFFDCFLLTQTLFLIFDVKTAIKNASKALKSGGILLATLPGICKICRSEMKLWGDYWRFTDASAFKLFGDVFGEENVIVETYGNVLSASAFLYGLASHELNKIELDYHDPDYQVTIAIRAVKK